MTQGTDRTRAAAAAAWEVEQRLTRSEGVLLLGAFATLAASMAAFMAL